MDHVRRPQNTPTLGVPDFGWAVARATQALILSANKKWTTIAPITLTASPLIVGSLSMVATTTGRFIAHATGVVNGDATGGLITMAMSHGPANLVADYTQATLVVFSSSGEGAQGTATIALIVYFNSVTVPFTAVVGSTTVFNLIATGVGGAHVSLPLDGLQFEVTEY
jgi:hypothetical protein